MQLSPLQSRLAASLPASCLLIVLYIILFAPQFAFAADFLVDRIPSGPLLDDESSYHVELEEKVTLLDARGPLYEPGFSLFDRSIIGRVEDGVVSLNLDQPTKTNIDPGNTVAYVFEVASVSGRSAQELTTSHELRRDSNAIQEIADYEKDEKDEEGGELTTEPGLGRRQQPSKTLYISANTCNQPGRISPDQTTIDPPQLTLYVSTSSENTSPGPGKDESTQKAIVFGEGAVVFNASLSRDVYFSISAPKVSTEYFNTLLPYNYELAVSLDGYHHAYDDQTQPNLYWVDSDASSTLLTTQNLTNNPDELISTPPYTIFVQNTKNLDINGLRNSYCGLNSWAQIRPLPDGNGQATMGLRQGGKDKLTMQEFYITGLNASTNYTGIVALNTSLMPQRKRADGPRGGVVVYNGVNFSTKPNGACTFLFNLTMCTETRYAVPGNPAKFPNGTALAAFYEDYIKNMWDNFDRVLQQTPCQAPPTQKYSLVKGCDHCKEAYKNWLCSVAIPRCEDFTSPDQSYLQMRNINAPFPDGSLVDQDIREKFGQMRAYNSSRNVEIDNKVEPGPYKEVLPCDYLCYELVKSCPASMGFSCPLPNMKYSFNTSYAVPDKSKNLSCNYPGSAHFPSAASPMTVSGLGMTTLVIILMLLLAS